MPEIIMIFVVLSLLIIPAGIVIGVIHYVSKRNNPPQLPHGSNRIEAKLLEIDNLRSRNLISEAEHEEKRKQILSRI